jgi:hypothetical protein
MSAAMRGTKKINPQILLRSSGLRWLRKLTRFNL